jgi:hypothetical protein
MKRGPLLILTFAVVMALVLVPAVSTAHERQGHHATVEPANFVRHVDNKFFPLEPGTTFFYAGTKEGIPSTSEFRVTHDTKEILGVTTTVIHDLAFQEGVLVEDTLDWFAQDKEGNVWYFGEAAKELDPNGTVISTEGSWEAGVDGAMAGIVMLAHPHVGNRYHQEVAPGVAQDMAKVVSLDKEKCIPLGCFDDLLLTEEWSPLKPGVVELKYYAEDVGLILALMVKGGHERMELVQVTSDDGE